MLEHAPLVYLTLFNCTGSLIFWKLLWAGMIAGGAVVFKLEGECQDILGQDSDQYNTLNPDV